MIKLDFNILKKSLIRGRCGRPANFLQESILIAFDFIWKVLLIDRNFATLLDLPLPMILLFNLYFYNNTNVWIIGALDNNYWRRFKENLKNCLSYWKNKLSEFHFNSIEFYFYCLLLDSEKPRLTCPKNLVINSDFDVKVIWSQGLFSDNVGIKSAIFTPANGSLFQSNKKHRVEAVVTDQQGNQDKCVMEVEIKGLKKLCLWFHLYIFILKHWFIIVYLFVAKLFWCQVTSFIIDKKIHINRLYML